MIAELPSTRLPVDPRQSFQELKTRLHRQLVDAIDLSKAGELPEEALRNQLQSLAAHICSLQQLNLSPADRDVMVREIMNEIYGFGPLQPLMDDPEISDVLVNGAQNVYIERSGMLMPTDVRFASDQHLLEFIQRVVGRAGRLSGPASGYQRTNGRRACDPLRRRLRPGIHRTALGGH